MPDLTPALPALGLLISGFAVMRLTAPPVRVPTTAYREVPAVYWPECVPLAERYESVTVLDPHRCTELVELFGARREVLYLEVRP